MNATAGRVLILLALLVSSAGAMAGFAAGIRGSAAGWRLTRALAYAFALLMAAANLVMVRALLARDFSVSYVAHVGSRSIPDWVAFVSLWSSLEGSILFWGLVLGIYIMSATALTSGRSGGGGALARRRTDASLFTPTTSASPSARAASSSAT